MIPFSLVGSTGLKSMWGSTAASLASASYITHLTAISSWRLEFAKLTMICLFLFMPVAAAGYSIYSENTDRPQGQGGQAVIYQKSLSTLGKKHWWFTQHYHWSTWVVVLAYFFRIIDRPF